MLALGNGAPDVFAARAALTGSASDFPLMLSDLLGASVFISTVVLGAVCLAASKKHQAWRVDRPVFCRDLAAYAFAVLAILATAADGRLEIWEALGFLGLYAAYIALVVGQSRAAKLKARAQAASPTRVPLLPAWRIISLSIGTSASPPSSEKRLAPGNFAPR